jgi:hypothetical protein
VGVGPVFCRAVCHFARRVSFGCVSRRVCDAEYLATLLVTIPTIGADRLARRSAASARCVELGCVDYSDGRSLWPRTTGGE